MNQSTVQRRDNGDFIIFLRTILMFLEHHRFDNTIKTFKRECTDLGYNQVASHVSVELDHKNTQTGEQSPIKNKPYAKTEYCPKCHHPIEKQQKKPTEDETQKQTRKTKNDTAKNKQTRVRFKRDVKSDELEFFKNKLSTLEDEHQKLMDVTMELTMALQKSIRGQTDNMNSIINNCKKIYPELFYANTENKPIIETNIMQLENKPAIEKIVFTNPDVQKLSTYFELDYPKISHDLHNGDVQTKLLLLQALRWRLTKSIESIRSHVIKSYFRHDLLELKTPDAALLVNLYERSPDVVQQAISQLVNTFASLKTGRDYVAQQSKLLNLILPIVVGTILDKVKVDFFTRDMMIATLQKLSLRYGERIYMIKSGLVEHMVVFLNENYKSVSTYCLEYSTALLMNLWLHNEAKEKCRPIALKIIKLLANLLDVNYNSCLPFVNGALYNLLSDSYFVQAAKSVGIAQLIKIRSEKIEGEVGRQLEYLVEMINNPRDLRPKGDSNAALETDDEMDILEPELDEDDISNISDVNGETFLYKYRLVFSKNVAQPTPEVPNLEEKSSTSEAAPKTQPIQKSLIDLENDTNNNKEKGLYVIHELSFCEEMQQFYHKPSKDAIFDKYLSVPDKTIKIKTNISSSLPASPNYLALADSKPSTAVEDTTILGTKTKICYKQSVPMSGNSSPIPSEASSKNKYSCECYDILKSSVDNEDQGVVNHSELRNCKYTVSNSTLEVSTRSELARSTERDSGVSSGKLDESDYEAVFESRPKILRTP